MKIGIYILRGYFLIVGLAGAFSIFYSLQELEEKSIFPILLSSFISVSFLIFSFKFDYVLNKSKTFMQLVVALLFFENVWPIFLETKVLSQMGGFSDIYSKVFAINVLVGLVFTSLLLFAIEIIYRKKALTLSEPNNINSP
mgnify:CR=1 FL=1